jgi:hypothetical protein
MSPRTSPKENTSSITPIVQSFIGHPQLDPTHPAHPGALLTFKSIEHFENTPETVIDSAQPAPNPSHRREDRETRLLIDTNPGLNGFVHDGIDQKLGSLDRRPRLPCTGCSEDCGERW